MFQQVVQAVVTVLWMGRDKQIPSKTLIPFTSHSYALFLCPSLHAKLKATPQSAIGDKEQVTEVMALPFLNLGARWGLGFIESAHAKIPWICFVYWDVSKQKQLGTGQSRRMKGTALHLINVKWIARNCCIELWVFCFRNIVTTPSSGSRSPKSLRLRIIDAEERWSTIIRNLGDCLRFNAVFTFPQHTVPTRWLPYLNRTAVKMAVYLLRN